MTKLKAKPCDTYPRVQVRKAKTNTLIGDMSPMEAYALADELTAAADAIMSRPKNTVGTA